MYTGTGTILNNCQDHDRERITEPLFVMVKAPGVLPVQTPTSQANPSTALYFDIYRSSLVGRQLRTPPSWQRLLGGLKITLQDPTNKQ